jgi:acetolactate synthase-1/3 small subunit
MTPSERSSTIAVLADNTLATLNRIMSVLRARQFNVLSVTPARTAAADIQAVSIVIGASPVPDQRIAACLQRIEEVSAVRTLEGGRAVCRELMLIKVERAAAPAGWLDDRLRDGTARVLDETASAVIVEMVGDPADLDRIAGALPAGAVNDLARIGPAVIWRD